MNRDIARALTAACTLGAQGYACFPCKPDKTPACPNGFKAATTDRDGILDLWRRYPAVLVGVATGEPSGIAVLDVDLQKHPEALAWWEVHRDRLLPARLHRTRSGGLHAIYRHRPGLTCSVSRINHGVDVRGTGGYVIWWPAAGLEVLADPGIRPWPEWLMPLLAPPAPSISQRAIEAHGSGGVCPALPRTIGLLRRVAVAPEGQRNKLLFWGACKVRNMCRAGELDVADGMQVLGALRRIATQSGLTQREISNTIGSAMRPAP